MNSLFLWILVLLFLGLWAAGMATGSTLHGFIHIFILAAVVMALFGLITGRPPAA